MEFDWIKFDPEFLIDIKIGEFSSDQKNLF